MTTNTAGNTPATAMPARPHPPERTEAANTRDTRTFRPGDLVRFAGTTATGPVVKVGRPAINTATGNPVITWRHLGLNSHDSSKLDNLSRRQPAPAAMPRGLTPSGGDMEIKCHRGYLDVVAHQGLIELSIREEPDGPDLASVALDPEETLTEPAIATARAQAHRQRAEIRQATERTMAAVLGDTNDYESLRTRLAELVEAGVLQAPNVLAHRARTTPCRTSTDGPGPAWVSAQCEDPNGEHLCDGCDCLCHPPAEPCCADPECGRR